jgi:hypothetical protein
VHGAHRGHGRQGGGADVEGTAEAAAERHYVRDLLGVPDRERLSGVAAAALADHGHPPAVAAGELAHGVLPAAACGGRRMPRADHDRISSRGRGGRSGKPGGAVSLETVSRERTGSSPVRRVTDRQGLSP